MHDVIYAIEAEDKNRIASYSELVQSLAAGADADPAEVSAILKSAGKTTDDLRSALQRISRQKALRAQLDEGPAIKARIAELKAEIVRRNDALEEYIAQHQRETRPVANELAETVRKQNGLHAIEREMRNEASDPDDRAELARLKSLEHAINESSWQIEREVSGLHSTIHSCRDDAERAQLIEQLKRANKRAIPSREEMHGVREQMRQVLSRMLLKPVNETV